MAEGYQFWLAEMRESGMHRSKDILVSLMEGPHARSKLAELRGARKAIGWRHQLRPGRSLPCLVSVGIFVGTLFQNP
jgi:hypothetical protein